MKFVDEVVIEVKAGDGGDGCVSFRREMYAPRGGPDGGDGGDGGSIYLAADPHLNTLVDFRYTRFLKAPSGAPGAGENRSGLKGADLHLRVPVGTVAFDSETEEQLGDLVRPGQELCVARGGFHGLGNARYKSSVNRAPRQSKPGSAGETRRLRLELKLLADVGLLGLPNAGKSTFIRAVSAARPKVADYPFTTLYPQLGVVRVGAERSFVVADIPGLIEGAADGAGLGVRFLKHLSRTRLLLHLVDIVPYGEQGNALQDIRTIALELERFSPVLAAQTRWLVFNKIDLLPAEEREPYCTALARQLDWQGPVFRISALQGAGVQDLVHRIAEYLHTAAEDAVTS